MKKRFDKEPLIRDYRTEARNLIKPLSMDNLYNLYDIVNNKLKQTVSEDRFAELTAVKKAIQMVPYIDQHKLKFIISGYKSEMAKHARPKDGYTKPNRKKV
jgi:hypothetical protein|tara:strand:+ start:1367 stop:1669 length:303 start_codon:yes stop_codon:yes gene_type:complete